jgi:hypothetical protein
MDVTATEASAAGRALVEHRWRGRGIDNALDVIASRIDEISPAQADRLADLSAVFTDSSEGARQHE